MFGIAGGAFAAVCVAGLNAFDAILLLGNVMTLGIKLSIPNRLFLGQNCNCPELLFQGIAKLRHKLKDTIILKRLVVVAFFVIRIIRVERVKVVYFLKIGMKRVVRIKEKIPQSQRHCGAT